MCLGIPGHVLGPTEHPDLMVVDVFGVERRINMGLMDGETIEPGDWVLIHVGFALSKLDEAEVRTATESLQMMGSSDEATDDPSTEEVAQWAS